MRCFLALDLPPAIRDPLTRLLARIPAGRLTDPDNLHLTLAFMGEQKLSLLEELHLRLEGLQLPSVALRIAGLDLLGGRTPRALAAMAAQDPALSALHKKMRGTLRGAGMDSPHVRFRPHVTLARFGSAGPDAADWARLRPFLGAHGDFALPAARAGSIGLYQSILRPDGADYELLAQYPLGRRAPADLPD